MSPIPHVQDSTFTDAEQVELMLMDNNTRALARFLGSVLLRANAGSVPPVDTEASAPKPKPKLTKK